MQSRRLLPGGRTRKVPRSAESKGAERLEEVHTERFVRLRGSELNDATPGMDIAHAKEPRTTMDIRSHRETAVRLAARSTGRV
ncbi:hypothetical protein GCM10023349_15170 [Nocardioides conyzicola]|uniref:Uncharacterized protein n=1 Tax=Nocardioides conyzicola TaxID=1651781 RepID=A0ABP8X5T5_9ACTN